MTQTLDTNAQNDIYLLPNGSLALLTGARAVAAACKTASLLQLREAIYQTLLGLPNFQTIWVGVPNIPIYESYLRQTLENVDGIVNVTSLTVKNQNNVFTYSAEAESIYGTIYLNG